MLKLKKLLFFCTVLVFLLGLGTLTTYADSSKTGTVTATTLNLRSYAKTSSKIVGTVKEGAKLTILKTSGSWYRVETSSGKTGWVRRDYVSLKKSTSTSASTSQTVVNKTGKVTASNVNLRRSASTSSSVVSTLKKGQTVTVLKSSNGWYKVETSSGKIGWTKSSFVSIRAVAAKAATVAKASTTSRGDIVREAPREETAAVAHDADLGVKVVDYAKNFLGVKYVYGGMSPEGFDCSGFVKYVYDHFNISIERVSTAQATQGAKISRSELEPGDLVFFDTNGGHNAVNHAGIYIGDGQFIQASSGRTTGKVVISNLNSGFYDESFMTARRFF